MHFPFTFAIFRVDSSIPKRNREVKKAEACFTGGRHFCGSRDFRLDSFAFLFLGQWLCLALKCCVTGPNR